MTTDRTNGTRDTSSVSDRILRDVLIHGTVTVNANNVTDSSLETLSDTSGGWWKDLTRGLWITLKGRVRFRIIDMMNFVKSRRNTISKPGNSRKGS